MTNQPNDVAAVKQAVKTIVRDTLDRLATDLSECPPSLVENILRDVWPDHGSVAVHVAGEINFRQQQGDSNHDD